MLVRNRCRYRYGVTQAEIERFVAENEVVKTFLDKYDSGLTGKGTRFQYAYALCRYFKWLRLVKGWDVSPKDLLNDQLDRLRDRKDVLERGFHVNLALNHARDNPDFKDLSDSRKYAVFVPIKLFYEYHDVPLTIGKGKFGKRKKRKHYRRQMTIEEFKKILDVLGQREKAIAMVMFQSGLEIGAVLYKFGYMWDQIKPKLESGAERIKIQIDERKGNGKWYFTYISRDAIQELNKWLVLRQQYVVKAKERFGYVDPKVEAGTPIFITYNANPYKEDHFFHIYDRKLRQNGLKKKAYSKVSHMIRKLFKTEASLPARGIDRSIVEFWVGHTEGVEKVGAEYDRTPEIYEKVIETEYKKLEPFINLYSSSEARLHDPLLQDIGLLSESPVIREFFRGVTEQVKAKVDALRKADLSA